jgi:O-acetyl-ADP-ribose deacetylase (regulator of RNase III)
MTDMKLFLRDRNMSLCDGWAEAFDGIPDVDISSGDIFAGPKASAIVSPANSFGFMDGGIDQVYTDHFGPGLQKRLQEQIREFHFGEIVVGDAEVVSTGNPDIPWCISAPTMRVPLDVKNTVNAYLAFRAALIVAKHHNQVYAGVDGMQIKSILCPGLGTAIGLMPYERCAMQMREAWDNIMVGPPKSFRSIRAAQIRHHQMDRGDK